MFWAVGATAALSALGASPARVGLNRRVGHGNYRTGTRMDKNEFQRLGQIQIAD
jgi:hypothetical protein